jgi:hypothetical protein
MLPGHFDQAVTLEGVRAIGKGFECRVRLPNGTLDETVISEKEAGALVVGSSNSATIGTAPANAEQIRLLIESTRIRLAYTHDPHFAVSLSVKCFFYRREFDPGKEPFCFPYPERWIR